MKFRGTLQNGTRDQKWRPILGREGGFYLHVAFLRGPTLRRMAPAQSQTNRVHTKGTSRDAAAGAGDGAQGKGCMSQCPASRPVGRAWFEGGIYIYLPRSAPLRAGDENSEEEAVPTDETSGEEDEYGGTDGGHGSRNLGGDPEEWTQRSSNDDSRDRV
eukprot:1149688-Pelagomonas_calceolata.AAC.1